MPKRRMCRLPILSDQGPIRAWCTIMTEIGSSGKAYVQIRKIVTLAKGRFPLERYTFEHLRRDGKLQTVSREVYKRQDSATILLYCRARRTVVLTRQFRLPVFVNPVSSSDPASGMSIELPGGLLGSDSPATAIRRETEEETGIHVVNVEKALEAYMSPTLLAERMHFFMAEYGPDCWKSPGGGLASEGEDIEVFESSFDEVLEMMAQNVVKDGKTLLLLLYAKTRGLFEPDSSL